jgi:hypothetical protein
MGQQIGCSRSTVHKAVQNTPELQAWARRQRSSAKAQSMNEVVTEAAEQDKEPDPEDEAAIREYVERADAQSRAWFLAQKREDQLAFLNDPDRHDKILGRKP